MVWLRSLQAPQLVQKSAISNQQSAIAQNTLQAGVEWDKIALKPTTEKLAVNQAMPSKSSPIKTAQKKPKATKPIISKPKSSEIDYSMVIAKGSTSSSGFPIITYTPRDPKNPEHRKAADAARQASGEQLANFVQGAAVAIGTPIKAVLDHTIGFAADALSQNHTEAAKKAQGIIAFGQGTVSLAGEMAGKALHHPEKIPYAVLIKPFVSGVQGIESGIETLVARSAAGDHNGAARALGGTVAMVPAVAQGGIFTPKIAKDVGGGIVKAQKALMKGVKQLPKGIGKEGGRLPMGNAPIAGRVVKAGAEKMNWTQQKLFTSPQPALAGVGGNRHFIHIDPQPEPRILTPMEEFRAAGDKLSKEKRGNTAKSTKGRPFEQDVDGKTPAHRAAANARTAANKAIDYRKLIENLKIDVTPEARAIMGEEAYLCFRDHLNLSFRILLETKKTSHETKLFLRKGIPIIIDKELSPMFVKISINNLSGQNSIVNLTINAELIKNLVIDYSKNKLWFNRTLKHEFFHVAYKTQLNRSLAFDKARSISFVSLKKYAPSPIYSRSFQKRAYIKAYLEGYYKEEILAERGTQGILEWHDADFSPQYKKLLSGKNGKLTGPLRPNQTRKFVKTQASAEYQKTFYQQAADTYDNAYPLEH